MHNIISKYPYPIRIGLVLVTLVTSIIAFAFKTCQDNGGGDREKAREAIIKQYELKAWKIVGREILKEKFKDSSSVERIRSALGDDYSKVRTVNYFKSIDGSDVKSEYTFQGTTINGLKSRCCEKALSSLWNEAKRDVFLECYLIRETGDNNFKKCLYKGAFQFLTTGTGSDPTYRTFYDEINEDVIPNVKSALEIFKLKKEYDGKTLESYRKAKEKIEKWSEGVIVINDQDIIEILGKKPLWSDRAVKITILNFIRGHENELPPELGNTVIDKLERAKNHYESIECDELATTIRKIKNEIPNDKPNAKEWFDEIKCEKPSFNRIFLILIGIVIISLAALYLIWRIKKQEKQIVNETPKPSIQQDKPDGDEIEAKYDAYIKEKNELINSLKSQVVDLEKENRNLADELRRKTQAQSITQPQVVRGEKRVNAVFYSIHPDTGVGFSFDQISFDRDEGYFYKITQMTHTEAEYEISSDPEIQIAAAHSANSILRGACEFENLPREITKGIVTVKKGSLKRSEKEWTIIEKARIRFV